MRAAPSREISNIGFHILTGDLQQGFCRSGVEYSGASNSMRARPGSPPAFESTSMSFLTHLECTHCGRHFDAEALHGACPDDGRPLYPRYDLDAVARAVRKEDLIGREASLWRYREFLPVRDPQQIVTLGEGWTPLLPLTRLAKEWGLKRA